MKRIIFTSFLFLVFITIASGGDIPEFINLGFSPDSSYFLFGQYGINETTGQPYSELLLIDTQKNEFVPNGAMQKSYAIKIEPGQNLAGVLFSLFSEKLAFINKYKIDYLNQGRLIYVLLNSTPQTATLQFKDFKTGAQYIVKISQSVASKGKSASSSFGISLSITEKNGKIKHLETGNPSFERAEVAGYAIRQIIMAPDEQTLVFVIEKKWSELKGSGFSYMIETLRIP